MSKTELSVIDFGPAELRILEDVSTELSACRTASEQKPGPRSTPNVLSVFLKMVDERLSGFVKDLRERMKTVKTA